MCCLHTIIIALQLVKVGRALLFSYFMLIWLRTNAFAEYMKLLKVDKILKLDEYNELHSNGYGGTYLDFLIEYYNDYFIVRLISCPVCLSFWLGLLATFIYGSPVAFLAAPLMLFFYLLFNRML